VWVVTHCLSWHGTCAPQSWADLGELLAATALIFGTITASFAALLSLG
jgi:hypothetical protein